MYLQYKYYLFIIFMNDAPDAIKHILDLYADDTTLQASDPDLSVLEQKLNDDLESLSKRLNENCIQPSTRNADSVKAFKAGYYRSVLG